MTDPIATLADAPAARSLGHIAFYPATCTEYFVSLGGVYRASWFDPIATFRAGGGSPGYRPAQYVCTVNDALFGDPAADPLPVEILTKLLGRNDLR